MKSSMMEGRGVYVKLGENNCSNTYLHDHPHHNEWHEIHRANFSYLFLIYESIIAQFKKKKMNMFEY